MGWISTVFVHKALDAAWQHDYVDAESRAQLYRLVGLDPSAERDPLAMVSDKAFFDLLERLLDLNAHARDLVIHMGSAMRCDDYGAFGLAFKSAASLLGSYRRVERYGKVVTSIANFRVDVAHDSVSMAVVPGRESRPGLSMTNELAVAAAVSLSHEVCRDNFAPAAVYFSGDKPVDDSAYRQHFGCPIHFGAGRDAFDVDAACASRPNRLSDEGISQFFEAHLDEVLSGIGDHSALEHRVLDQIGDALSEGVPALSRVAGRMAMSTRSLQRRLAEADLSYQELVGQARKRLAVQLLTRTDYPLAEIAFLTGFSDQSGFTRAFKRWHGKTPGAFRRGE